MLFFESFEPQCDLRNNVDTVVFLFTDIRFLQEDGIQARLIRLPVVR